MLDASSLAGAEAAPFVVAAAANSTAFASASVSDTLRESSLAGADASAGLPLPEAGHPRDVRTDGGAADGAAAVTANGPPWGRSTTLPRCSSASSPPGCFASGPRVVMLRKGSSVVLVVERHIVVGCFASEGSQPQPRDDEGGAPEPSDIGFFSQTSQSQSLSCFFPPAQKSQPLSRDDGRNIFSPAQKSKSQPPSRHDNMHRCAPEAEQQQCRIQKHGFTAIRGQTAGEARALGYQAVLLR